MSREIEVWADWRELGGAILMGLLRVISTRGKDVFSFEYDRMWLENHHSVSLDPELQFFEGPQYLDAEVRPNFGLFLDSSPDRWGRVLMQRREAIVAKKEERAERRLREVDFLLGVHDEQRSGALRFRDPNLQVEWLSEDRSMAAPPWASLRELQQASWMMQTEDPRSDPSYSKWLNMLMAPGSSLGGARPKCGVRDEMGQLWIAKFPGRGDDREVAAWEMVAHQLAQNAGVKVPAAKLERFKEGPRTFLSQRFDRVLEDGILRRVHFASAMTVLGYRDGDGAESGASYLELAEWLIRNGACPDDDLRQLWRRIVFSIAIRNTDDHLRNHGFLLTSDGWRLSPAYDVNPDPDGGALSLNISETDNSLNFDLAMKVAEFFRVSAAVAEIELAKIRRAVSRWRKVANALQVGRAEQEFMASAFAQE